MCVCFTKIPLFFNFFGGEGFRGMGGEGGLGSFGGVVVSLSERVQSEVQIRVE